MTIRSVLVYGVVGCLLTTTPVPAEGRSKSRAEAKIAREARKHEKQGLKLLKRGQLDRAIEELQIAYGLTQEPELLFHIAEAFNAKQDYVQALYYYRSYREQDPRGAERRKVDTVIEALMAMPGVTEASSTTASSEPATTEPATTEPATTEPATPPSTTDPDDGPSPPATIATAPTVTTPAPSVPPASTPDRSAGRGRRTAGLIVGGGGLVLVGVGAYYAKVAGDRADEITRLFDDGAMWSPADAARYDEGRAAETRAIVLTAAGGAAVVTGAVLYYLGWRAGAAPQLEFQPATGGGSVRLTCDF